MKLIAHGAEAKIYKTKLFNKDIIIKKRIKKAYRNEIIDSKIIKLRNKEEANILKKVKKNNLNTPYLYYVSENKIIMEYIPNKKKHLAKSEEIGKEIAKLHNINIIHGDLNLINILVNDKIYFIDFGLGQTSNKIEDKATDLLVFKKTLLSKKKTEKIWNNIIKGYLQISNSPDQILNKILEIEKRGRYLK